MKTQQLGGKSGGKLPDLSHLTQEQLLQRLAMMVAMTDDAKNKLLHQNSSHLAQNSQTKKYTLTVDNLLKMALIVMRIRARVPVIIMGETGCGKTRFLVVFFFLF